MMPQSATITPLAVIPVFNHAGTLRQVVEQTLGVLPDVLVVDDGSSDEGLDVLDGLDVNTVRHDSNQGKGAAILTAIEYASRHVFSHIITIDADGQHDPADIDQFLPVLEACPESIVVGSRDFSGPNIPASSRFGRSFSNFWLRVQTGAKVSDVQCGFRAYSVAVVKSLKLRERRYSFEVEVLVKAAWAGFSLSEVDISVYYPQKEDRISHFHALKDNLRITALNTRLTTRSFMPVPHRQMAQDEEGKFKLLSPLQSLRLLLAAKNTPRDIALAGALGLFVGAFPIFGFHCLTLVVVSGFLGISKVAALGTNQLCIPPFMPALCVEVGYYIRHGHWLTDISLQTIGYEAHLRLLDWVIGACVVGPVAAVVVGGLLLVTAKALQSVLEAEEQA